MTEKRCYLPHFRLDEGFKGTVVNRELPFLHIEITLTVPLIYFIEGDSVKLQLSVVSVKNQ